VIKNYCFSVFQTALPPLNMLRLIVGFVAFALAVLVAIANWGGCIGAYRKRNRGGASEYLPVMLLSIMCSFVAWFAIKEEIGLWSFAPAAIDLGTICLIALPFFLLKKAIQKK
jgi:hypothetical protein